jgi:HEAT repeat protein
MSQFLQLILVLALAQTPALDSASPRERSDAVESMASLGNRDAVPLLAEAYKNEQSSEIRTSIVRAFGRIRDQSAIPALSEALLTDFQQEVRLQAIDSLLRIYIPVSDERGFWNFITDVTRVFSEDDRLSVGPNVYVDDSAKEVLVEALRNDFDWEVRVAAVNALGSLNAADQLPALIEELDGPRHREDWEVQIGMIRSMGVIGSQDSGPALTRLIRDGDERVAREAILSVGRTGYRTAFPALSNLFRTSDDGDMRDLALESIGLLREPAAIDLFESLLDSDEDSYRELAARGLARLDYDASSFAERIAIEGDAEVRLAQAFALVAFGNSMYLQELVDALDSRRDQIAEVYLFELGRYEGRLGEFYPHLRNPDADIRAKLVRVVGQIGMPEARPYIQPLTQDSNLDVAEAAVEALRSLAP